MVADLEDRRVIRSREVAHAFLGVPRHHFLPGESLETVYSDRPVVTKMEDGVPVSSSSQPAVMARMLEQLQLGPGMNVLEIGAGTGYNAALMASLVGQGGRVTSVDIDQDLVDAAGAHVAAAGVEGVALVLADGLAGWPAAAPYDRIILTVGSDDVYPAWVDQLTDGGRLLLPLGLSVGGGVQRSVVFRRVDGHLESMSAEPCGFMTLRGKAAFGGGLALEPALRLLFEGDGRVDLKQIQAWLAGPATDEYAAIAVSEVEAFGSLQLWLSMTEPGFCVLLAGGPTAERQGLPGIVAGPGYRSSYGLLGDGGLCLLTRRSAGDPNVVVRAYGDQPELARRLKRRLVQWDAADRPCGDRLRIRAFRNDAAEPAGPGGVSVRRSVHTFVLECD